MNFPVYIVGRTMSLAIERDNTGEIWIIQVRDPAEPGRKLARLEDEAAARSFNYELSQSMAFAKASGEMGI
jgi:hypothetical protein